MALTKEQVFLVSGRSIGVGDNVPRGPVVDCVVCSPDSDSVRLLLGQVAPHYSVISVTSLVVMEESVKKIKAALSGQEAGLTVVVDPVLEAMAAA